MITIVDLARMGPGISKNGSPSKTSSSPTSSKSDSSNVQLSSEVSLVVVDKEKNKNQDEEFPPDALPLMRSIRRNMNRVKKGLPYPAAQKFKPISIRKENSVTISTSSNEVINYKLPTSNNKIKRRKR